MALHHLGGLQRGEVRRLLQRLLVKALNVLLEGGLRAADLDRVGDGGRAVRVVRLGAGPAMAWHWMAARCTVAPRTPIIGTGAGWDLWTSIRLRIREVHYLAMLLATVKKTRPMAPAGTTANS